MKTYGDLELAKIRDACSLDFARHTYSRGQCSCCFGPMDMPDEYWAGGKKPVGKAIDELTYILFKNAENGRGIRGLLSPVEDYTYVEYSFSSDEQKHQVCQMLQEKLGDEYVVNEPENSMICIEIRLKSKMEAEQEEERRKKGTAMMRPASRIY